MKIQSGLIGNYKINTIDVFVCNEAFYYQAAEVLDQYLAQYHTDGTYLWSMKANGYVEVGAKGFDTYNWMGKNLLQIIEKLF